jgi:hypothetical protein
VPSAQRLEELGLRCWPAVAGEQVAHLGGNSGGHQDLAPCEAERGQQVDALSMVIVVRDGSGDERAGVADDHRLAAESFGQDLVYASGGVCPLGCDRAEPRRGPPDLRGRLGQASNLGSTVRTCSSDSCSTRRRISSLAAVMKSTIDTLRVIIGSTTIATESSRRT